MSVKLSFYFIILGGINGIQFIFIFFMGIISFFFFCMDLIFILLEGGNGDVICGNEYYICKQVKIYDIIKINEEL